MFCTWGGTDINHLETNTVQEAQVKVKMKYLKILKQPESVTLNNAQGSPELYCFKPFLSL